MAQSDIERQVAELTVLLEVSRELGATTELVPLLGRVEEAARKVLECERASVFLYDRDTDELYSKVATGVEELRFSAQLGIAGEVARAERAINVPDAYADQRFNPEVDRKTGFVTRNMLALPLLGYDGQLIGVLQFLNRRGGPFTSRDEALGETLSAQAGVALQRQVLLDHHAEKLRLEQELDIARDIQQALLPAHFPVVGGFDIAGWNRPADRTGGDYYDFLPLSGGLLALSIADATGHGIGPALMMAECRALMRAVAILSEGLGASGGTQAAQALPEMMSRVNELLCSDLPSDRFVTQFFAILDGKTARLSYVSAGQGPILLYHGAQRMVRELPTTGLPLGMLSGAPYTIGEEVVLETGDILVLLTDGFFEWHNPQGELFGSERVGLAVVRYASLPCAEMIKALCSEVEAFAGGTVQADDLTAVLVKRTG